MQNEERLFVPAIAELIDAGLGIGSLYGIIWSTFFSNAVFPANIDVAYVMTLWLLQLLTFVGTIVVIRVLLHKNAARILLSTGGTATLAIALGTSLILLSIAMRLVPDLIAAHVLLMVVFSVSYGFLFFVMANDICHTDVHTISLATPFGIMTGALVSIIVSNLHYIVGIAVLSVVLTLVLYLKVSTPFDLGPNAARLASRFDSSTTNTAFFKLNAVRPIYVMMAAESIVVALFLVNQDGNDPVMLRTIMFAIIVATAIGSVAYIVVRNRDISLLGLVEVIAVALVAALVAGVAPVVGGTVLDMLFTMVGWTMFEYFYWVIYVGRATVTTPDEALLVFVRTRGTLQFAMAIGVAVALSLSAFGLLEYATTLWMLLVIVVVGAAVMLMHSVTREAVRDTAAPTEQESEPAPHDTKAAASDAQTIEPESDGSPEKSLTLDEQIQLYCELHENEFTLTKREKEVLKFVVMGRPVENISSSLYISVSTAKGHIAHIYDKTGIHKRGQLIEQFAHDVNAPSLAD